MKNKKVEKQRKMVNGKNEENKIKKKKEKKD